MIALNDYVQIIQTDLFTQFAREAIKLYLPRDPYYKGCPEQDGELDLMKTYLTYNSIGWELR